jgi:hypothetical protein
MTLHPPLGKGCTPAPFEHVEEFKVFPVPKIEDEDPPADPQPNEEEIPV